MPDDSLLAISLSAAVPLWQEELKALPWSEVDKLREEAARVIAEKGDVIQFRSKKKGETADAFNHLAKGIAILSFAPGGVSVASVKHGRLYTQRT